MSQDSDNFSTPKRPSKLSLSNTRKTLNVHKHSYSESCRISQVLSPSSPGTCSADGDSSGTPLNKQNTLITRKTVEKKQVELSSQSDTDDLPSLHYVPLYRSPPTMPANPVAST